MAQSHHLSPSLLLFQVMPLVLKNMLPDPERGSTSSPPHCEKDCGRQYAPCGLPRNVRAWYSDPDENTGTCLVDRWAQSPSYVHFIPSGPDLQGSASRLLWWNSELWRGLGRGGEENVVLIQLWNTTCGFVFFFFFIKDRKEEHKQQC